MSSNKCIRIDGSVMEGGGQILRISIALSGLLQKNIEVFNIRAGRSKPGLRPQHLAGLRLANKICKGKLSGDEVGSTAINFQPSEITGGNYSAAVGTAGSVMLIFQVAFPLLLFADKPSEVILEGGTNAEMAPQIDETLLVFKPIAEYFGAKFSCSIIKRGYYPAGGGCVKINVDPIIGQMRCIKLVEPGILLSIKGRSFVAGKLPLKVAHSIADNAIQILRKHFSNIKVDIKKIKESDSESVGTGSGITLFAETDTGCFIGGAALGKRGVSDEEVATSAAQKLANIFEKNACVDNFTQDQLILFMALAKGKSNVKIADFTLHTKTAIFVAEILADVKFDVSESERSGSFIECEGIGLMKH